ncbi:hypothetical protein BGZ94_003467 [Podila epigama]|nr:hypothetical protein BGZ94_003467 [Podila epigama]
MDDAFVEDNQDADNQELDIADRVLLEDRHEGTLRCPSCNGPVTVDTDEWITVCSICGHVLSEAPIVIHQSEQFEPHMNLVDESGRAIYGAMTGGNRNILRPDNRQLQKRRAEARSRVVRDLLSSTARVVGVAPRIVDRACRLCKIVHDMRPDPNGSSFRYLALGCFYLACKEMSAGLTLRHLSTVTRLSTVQIGAKFKQARNMLLEHASVELDPKVFNDEDRHWLELSRLLYYQSEDMPQELMDVIGETTDPKEKRMRLQKIAQVAQNCLNVAIESGIATGRHASGLVSACVILAVRSLLRLKEREPAGMMEFASNYFMVSKDTIGKRLRELERSLMLWKERLPYLDKKRVKKADIIDYLDEIFMHYRLLHSDSCLGEVAIEDDDGGGDDDEVDIMVTEDNRRSTEKRSIDRSGVGSEEDEEEEGQAPGGLQDLLRSVMRAAEAEAAKSTHSEDIQEEQDALFRPPSYLVGVRRRARQQRRLELAKKTLGLATSTDLCKQEGRQEGQEGQDRQNGLEEDDDEEDEEETREKVDTTDDGADVQAEHAAQIKKAENEGGMLEDIKVILKLGRRTEEELLDATPGVLAHWAQRDANVLSRPDRDMDAEELSCLDLTEEEWQRIARTKAETEGYWRVKGPEILEAEELARSRTPLKRRTENRQQQKREASFDDHGVGKRHKPLRAGRSSKLNYAALEQLERELEDTGDVE